MFGSKKTTVINTTTVDNNIYLDNDIQNDVDVTAEFNPTFQNTVDTQPIADAVAAPLDRMAQGVLDAMEANTQAALKSSDRQALAITALAGGLGKIGDGLQAEKEGEGGLAKFAASLEPMTKIAAAVLTLGAVYYLFTKRRLPDIEVSA